MKLYYNENISFIVDNEKISTISRDHIGVLIQGLKNPQSPYKWHILNVSISEYMYCFNYNIADLEVKEFNSLSDIENAFQEYFI